MQSAKQARTVLKRLNLANTKPPDFLAKEREQRSKHSVKVDKEKLPKMALQRSESSQCGYICLSHIGKKGTLLHQTSPKVAASPAKKPIVTVKKEPSQDLVMTDCAVREITDTCLQLYRYLIVCERCSYKAQCSKFNKRYVVYCTQDCRQIDEVL